MKRGEAKQLLPILQAFADGKKIEYRPYDGNGWFDVGDICMFNIDRYTYRIKPTPKYRPFANAEECWNEMLKHQPFGWLKSKKLRTFVGISEVVKDGCELSINGFNKYEVLFNSYNFADGQQFGIKEESEG